MTLEHFYEFSITRLAPLPALALTVALRTADNALKHRLNDAVVIVVVTYLAG